MCEWISIEDRLPETGGEVLVAGDGGVEGKWSGRACFSPKFGKFILENGGEVSHTTHWMPFPAPPDEEDQTECTILETTDDGPQMTISVTLWTVDAIIAFWARGEEVG